jgi:DNA-binding CsgD family transcriptional regulator
MGADPTENPHRRWDDPDVGSGIRQELSTALAAMIAGRRSVVLVGEPGVGKTTLARAVVAALDHPVFEGGALATLSWIDHLCLRRALGRDLIGADPAALAHDVVDAVGDDGVLLLEDLHWADPGSLDVIGLLADRIPVVGTVRTGAASTERVLAVLRSAGFAELAVAPLDEAAALGLVRSLRSDLSPEDEAIILRRAGGNPLLLTELAGHTEPPASLRRSLGARLRSLDPLGRRTFELIALAGRPLPADLLGAGEVRGLINADLVRVGDGTVAARHALLAETAVQLMDGAAQKVAHATLARLITEPGESARHHDLAGEPELALAKALTAADHAERPAEAATHLALAARLSRGDAADELRLRAARALESVHDWQAAGGVLDTIEGDDPQIRALAALLRVRGAWVAGRPSEVREALDAGLALTAGSGSDIEVRLRVERARVPIFIDCDLDAGVETAEHAWQLASHTGVAVDRAEYFFGTALSIADRPGAAEHLRAAIDLARRSGDTETELSAGHNLIAYHQSRGSLSAGRQLAAAMHDRATELERGRWQNSLRATAAQLAFHAGDLRACLAETEQLLVSPADSRARDLVVEVRALALVDAGRTDEALRLVTDRLAHAVDDYRGLGQLQWVRAEAEVWGGRPRRALPPLADYLAGPPGDVNRAFGLVTLAWARHESGLDPGEPAPEQSKPILAAVPLETAAVALLGDDPTAAADLFHRAAATWAPYHRRGELRCRWAQGEALRLAGDGVRAATVLESVECAAESDGHAMVLARIRRSLRQLGVRRTAARTSDPSGLTGREREVLELVGQGLSNAQIAARLGIGRSTVVTLVESASTKLGATSRVQAASLVQG